MRKLCQKVGKEREDGSLEDEYCYLCDDGGELVCCEYCRRVAHQECIGYMDSMEDIDWVYNCCILDVCGKESDK